MQFEFYTFTRHFGAVLSIAVQKRTERKWEIEDWWTTFFFGQDFVGLGKHCLKFWAQHKAPKKWRTLWMQNPKSFYKHCAIRGLLESWGKWPACPHAFVASTRGVVHRYCVRPRGCWKRFTATKHRTIAKPNKKKIRSRVIAMDTGRSSRLRYAIDCVPLVTCPLPTVTRARVL